MKWIQFFAGILVGIIILYQFDKAASYHDKFGVINLQPGERTTLISLSPNNLARAILVNKRSWGDREVEIRVQEEGKDWFSIVRASIFVPAGSERIIWSTDSSKFILVKQSSSYEKSDEFPSEFRLRNGEVLYLLYNLKDKQMYCHTPALLDCLPLPSNAIDEFHKISFHEFD